MKRQGKPTLAHLAFGSEAASVVGDVYTILTERDLVSIESRYWKAVEACCKQRASEPVKCKGQHEAIATAVEMIFLDAEESADATRHIVRAFLKVLFQNPEEPFTRYQEELGLGLALGIFRYAVKLDAWQSSVEVCTFDEEVPNLISRLITCEKPSIIFIDQDLSSESSMAAKALGQAVKQWVRMANYESSGTKITPLRLRQLTSIAVQIQSFYHKKRKVQANFTPRGVSQLILENMFYATCSEIDTVAKAEVLPRILDRIKLRE